MYPETITRPKKQKIQETFSFDYDPPSQLTILMPYFIEFCFFSQKSHKNETLLFYKYSLG